MEAIVVLGGDQDRWTWAEALIRQEVAPRTLSTLTEPGCQSEISTGQECQTGVRNTVDEALLMRRILAEAHIAHAGVVTSDYHILRAGAVFALIFAGSGIQIEMIPAPSVKRSHMVVLFRELGMLGPSIGGAILGKFAPRFYEFLMRQRYHTRSFSAVSTCSALPQHAVVF